jgi:hypothetical protein
MKKRAFILKIAAAAALSLSMTSCAFLLASAGAAVGTGVYNYVQNELKVTEEIDFHTATVASRRALRDLEYYEVYEEDIDGNTRRFVAENADNQRIVIRLDGQTKKVTTFNIRVGVMGDKDIATFIFDRIKENFSQG